MKICKYAKFDDNHQGCENFVHNESPGEKAGHKWRLKTLWEVIIKTLANNSQILVNIGQILVNIGQTFVNIGKKKRLVNIGPHHITAAPGCISDDRAGH